MTSTPPSPDAPPDYWETLQRPIEDDIIPAFFGRVVDNTAQSYTIEQGGYLTADVLPYDQLPRHAFLNANTGLGKTTYALGLPGQKIIVASGTLALEQILKKDPTIAAYYGKQKNATTDSQTIVTIYESFGGLLAKIDASRFYLIVDESHNFAASSNPAFRGKGLTAVIETMGGAWRGVLLMTGTPIPLSHPALVNFEHVNIISHLRQQKAQRVVWRDADGNGDQLNAVVSMIHGTNETHLIFLNSKGTALEKTIAALMVNGYKREQIANIHSDNKSAAAGRGITENERIPDGIKVLITTAVAIESLNIADKFDNIHIVSPLHPALAHQLGNRLRTAAAGCVYTYNNGTGKGYSPETAVFQRHYARQAQEDVSLLNRLESANPNDESPEAIIARRSIRSHKKKAGAGVRIDQTLETGQKRWAVSWLGVDNLAFDAMTDYYNGNPIAYQNALKVYGWAWGEDVIAIHPKTNKSTKAARLAVSEPMKAAREDAHIARVDAIKEKGEQWARNDGQQGEGADRRAANAVISLLDLTNHNGNGAAFNAACDMVKAANDSTRKLNTITRQIRIHQLLQDGDPFTRQLSDAFQIGEKLTNKQIQERIMAVYDASPIMSTFSRKVLRLPYSKEKESRITERTAVGILGDFFEIETKVERVGDMQIPTRIYTVKANAWVTRSQLVTLNLSNSIDKFSVTNDAEASKALALPSSSTYDLDDIPITEEENARYKAAQLSIKSGGNR